MEEKHKIIWDIFVFILYCAFGPSNILAYKCFERINVADYTPNLLPVAFTYTNPDPTNDVALNCTQWTNLDPNAPQSSNFCIGEGDEHMYCRDASGQKQYCRCDHVNESK